MNGKKNCYCSSESLNQCGFQKNNPILSLTRRKEKRGKCWLVKIYCSHDLMNFPGNLKKLALCFTVLLKALFYELFKL